MSQRKPSRRLQYQRILGTHLLAIRSGKKFEQKRVAARCGFDQGTLSKIELGKRGTSLESLLVLCDALGVDVFAVLISVAMQYRAERLSLDDGEYYFASPELRLLDALALYSGFPEHRLPAGPILPIGAHMPDEKPISEMTMTELVANQLDQEPIEESEKSDG